MLTCQTRPAAGVASLVLVSGAVAMLAGCQSYQPKPLDLAAHRDAWLARSAGDEPVRAFAERLARTGEQGSFDASDGISLEEAEIVAIVLNPDLRLARLRAGLAAATAEHAGLWEDPQFGLDFMSLTERSGNPLVVSPGLSFSVPISGRLGAEKARAEAANAAELTRVAEEEWRVRMDVRRVWFRWSAARMKAEQSERLIASIESLVDSTARLAEAGEIIRTEAALFRIEHATQRQAMLGYRGEAAEAEQELRTLVGLSPSADLDLIPTIATSAELEKLTPENAAAQNLTLARLREEYQIAEQTLRREVREQYPDLTIGPMAEFDRGDTLLGFSLSLPVPILNANKQGIAEAEAERELARAAFETAYERIVGMIESTRTRLDTLHEQRATIETELVPLVDRQLADAESLLRLGEGGSLVLLESLARVAQTQNALIDARLGESLAIIRLAELVGPSSSHPAERSYPDKARSVPANTTMGEAAREVIP